MQPCSARSCGWQTDTGEVPLPCVHVKLLCLSLVVVGSWLDLFRSVYCDQGAPSGGECRPRGVYRGLRSPAAFARPDLSVDPAVFTTAADARQKARQSTVHRNTAEYQLWDYFASVRICSHLGNSYHIKMNQLNQLN